MILVVCLRKIASIAEVAPKAGILGPLALLLRENIRTADGDIR